MPWRMAKPELESVATGTVVYFPLPPSIVVLVAMGLERTVYLEVITCLFYLEVKYLILVYLEVKCWTFLFLFKVFYFEVKYPHAWE